MTTTFKNFTILYIEDDDGVRDVNFSMFKRIFKDAFEAKNGEIGYKIYLDKSPDIIVTDIKMPKMNGIELAEKIRENDEETKIIITSAFSDEKYLLAAIELNLERYIVKPLTRRNLFPALEKAIFKIKKRLMITDDFYYDFRTLLFYYKNEVVSLTKKELSFLSLLVECKDKIVTYEEIEESVWGFDESMSVKSLRTTIGVLRKKIPSDVITNVSNIGYKLNINL